MGPAWGSEISSEPRSAEPMGQGPTTPPRAEQKTQASGLPLRAPLLPPNQIVLFGGWCSLEPW